MPRGKMTEAHKIAIKQGRKEGLAVKSYLDQVAAGQRRAADPKAIQRRLMAVESKISGEKNRLKLLDLHQQRLNLSQALDAAGESAESADLEKQFVAVAAAYAKRKDIDYRAFRALGVPATTLKKAGIRRSSS